MTESHEQGGYQVLARKYRPNSFDALIGQDALVRTLRNAFEAGRIAHAFILTGVRGVGKTTTARIIAKGLNCTAQDHPTMTPCGACDNCRAIAESRHVDVMEMDAASRTGVDDIREITDSVRYRAASARYKVYIIDEVHMLSKAAFNGLLKTLEEPPPHVKFILATTEIRKVPVTILSRCQRFDLRRVEAEVLIGHMRRIIGAEGAQLSDEALALIARAAEGSVRDALSLLDQAIAHSGGEGDAEAVRAMLGLADRARVFDLLDLVMKGEAAAALSELRAQYHAGAEPQAVLRELAEAVHWVSVVKIAPEAAADPTITPAARDRGLALAQALSIRALTRAWQMLLKGLEEVARAPAPMAAAEMVIIRLTHVADLPPPDELIRRLTAAGAGTAAPRAPGTSPAPPAGPKLSMVAGGGTAMTMGQRPQPMVEAAGAAISSLADVARLIQEKRDLLLLIQVETHMHPISVQPGRIEFEPSAHAPPTLARDLAEKLQAWTGRRWVITIGKGGGPTLAEERDRQARDLAERAQLHPLVAAVLRSFEGATLQTVRRLPGYEAPMAAASSADSAETEADVSFDADFDPFEED